MDHIERLRKLHALAEQGDAGERENAKVLLEKLMKKYNVSEASLDDGELGLHELSYKTPYERKLIHQLIYKIAPDRTMYSYKSGKGKRSIIVLECTQAEAMQIQIEFEFYRTLWEEELELFFVAFVHKHQIFCSEERSDWGHAKIPEEDVMRMWGMAASMQDKDLRPMLEAGKE